MTRPPAGTRTPPEFNFIMLIHEAQLQFKVARYGDEEPLTTTRRLLTYLSDGVAEETGESLWLVCLNPGRRPLGRTRLAQGPLVAAVVGARDVFRVVILAEARALTLLRTTHDGPVHPGPADLRLIATLREACRLMDVEFVDYLIAAPGGSDCHSWREHAGRSR